MAVNLVNTINYTYGITAQQLADQQARVQAMYTDFANGLLELNSDQNALLSKTGVKSVGWVAKVYNYARKNPQMLQGFMDLDQFGSDLAGQQAMTDMAQSLSAVVNLCNNTATFLGARSGSAARNCYKGFQAAAEMGQPGAQLIVDDLSPQFAAQSRAAKPVDGGGDDTPADK